MVSSAGAGLCAGAAGVCAELSGLAKAIKNMQAKAPARTGRLSAEAVVFKNEAGSLVKKIPGHGRTSLHCESGQTRQTGRAGACTKVDFRSLALCHSKCGVVS